jgi:hypothetical protein
MNERRLTPRENPTIFKRLLDLACDIVGAAPFLHTQGGIARAFSYQLPSAGTSTGANAEESDGASSFRNQMNWCESSARSFITRFATKPVAVAGAPGRVNRTSNLNP